MNRRNFFAACAGAVAGAAGLLPVPLRIRYASSPRTTAHDYLGRKGLLTLGRIVHEMTPEQYRNAIENLRPHFPPALIALSIKRDRESVAAYLAEEPHAPNG